MEKRIPEARINSNKATVKFKQRFDSAGPEKKIKCIMTFYEVAEIKSLEEMADIRKLLEMRSELEVSNYCWELCMEAINRDFCSHIQTGKSGDVGKLVYAALK